MKNYRQTYPPCCLTCQSVVYHPDGCLECSKAKLLFISHGRKNYEFVDTLGVCDEYKKREAEK